MFEVNVSEFRRVLEAKYEELSFSASNRDEIVVETTADEIDRLQQQLSRDIAVRNLDRTSALLKSIRAALDRIEDDIYGECAYVVKSPFLKSVSRLFRGPHIVSTVKK